MNKVHYPKHFVAVKLLLNFLNLNGIDQKDVVESMKLLTNEWVDSDHANFVNNLGDPNRIETYLAVRPMLLSAKAKQPDNPVIYSDRDTVNTRPRINNASQFADENVPGLGQ